MKHGPRFLREGCHECVVVEIYCSSSIGAELQPTLGSLILFVCHPRYFPLCKNKNKKEQTKNVITLKRKFFIP